MHEPTIATDELRPTYLEVDLGVLAGNYRAIAAHVAPAREVGEHRRTLVVGMRGDVQNRTQFVELIERLLDFGGSRKAPLTGNRRATNQQQSTENFCGRSCLG